PTVAPRAAAKRNRPRGSQESQRRDAPQPVMKGGRGDGEWSWRSAAGLGGVIRLLRDRTPTKKDVSRQFTGASAGEPRSDRESAKARKRERAKARKGRGSIPRFRSSA